MTQRPAPRTRSGFRQFVPLTIRWERATRRPVPFTEAIERALAPLEVA